MKTEAIEKAQTEKCPVCGNAITASGLGHRHGCVDPYEVHLGGAQDDN